MSNFTSDQMSVAGNVLAIALKFHAAGLCSVPPLVHLAATKQESAWNEGALNTSDPNGSYGPYQINQAAHPNTAQLSVSPWADYAFYICAQPWEAAWSSEVNELWQDPNRRGYALELFVPKAQGSIAWPIGLGETRYEEALEMLELLS